MKVDNENDRMEMPEECDYCSSDVDLERYYSYGPGHNVDWLCPYCSVCFTKNPTLRSIASMFNTLEERLKR